jgi:formylglycine-generating enzyme required for sulfatase activity
MRTIDLVTTMPGALRELGTLPLNRVSIPPGYHRFIVDLGAARVHEFTRMASAGSEIRITTHDPLGAVAGRDMIRIAGGTLRLHDGTPLSSLEDRAIPIEPFWLDACEVSNADYRRFLTATGHPPPSRWMEVQAAAYDDFPVVNVSWTDAMDYAEWIGKRLPSFAEWMWAARGDEGRRYPWATSEPGSWKGNTQRELTVVRSGAELANYLASAVSVTSDADARTPNGLYHMLGNVSEWTESVLMAWSGAQFVPRDGSRIVVGQAWDAANKVGIQSTLAWFAHYGTEAAYANYRTGFRCAKGITDS